MIWEDSSEIAWELLKNIRKVFFPAGERYLPTMHRKDACFLFPFWQHSYTSVNYISVLICLLPLALPSRPFLLQEWPFLLFSLKALWQWYVSCSWHELPFLKHVSTSFCFQVALLLLPSDGFHMWGAGWILFFFLQVSSLRGDCSKGNSINSVPLLFLLHLGKS